MKLKITWALKTHIIQTEQDRLMSWGIASTHIHVTDINEIEVMDLSESKKYVEEKRGNDLIILFTFPKK